MKAVTSYRTPKQARVIILAASAISIMNLYDEFHWRGMLHEATPDLQKILAEEKLTA